MLNFLKNKEFVVLDTETTGLGDDAEIVEISVIRNDGKVLINCLVKPTKPIPQDAINIHGITTEQAMGGREWSEVFAELEQIAKEYPFVIFNAEYDMRLINQTCELHDNKWFSLDFLPVVYCAMLEYAEFWGETTYRGFKWQSLINAAKQQGVEVKNAHRALGDCLMTLGVMRKVWGA
jgi:DNA polymerase III epsilon subunit-like protein